MTTTNPTGAQGRPSIHRVLFPLGLGTALSLLGDATLYTVLPTHAADAGVALTAVGILLGVNRAIRLFTNRPAGWAYDRWPRRRLFVPALFLGALSTAIYAATRGFWPLLLGRLLWGVAWSGIWVGGATMILDVPPAHERGRWTGVYQIWFFVGTTLGSLGGGVLTDVLGYAATNWICAALTAAGALVALILLPETFRGVDGARGPGPAAQTPASEPPALKPGTQDLAGLGHGVRSKLWLAVSLQGINRFILSGVASATLGLLVQDWMQSADLALGVASVTGLLMAGRTVLSMIAAPAAGTLSDRLASRWTVVGWGLGIGAVGMALLAWHVPLALLLGIGAVAVSGGSLQSLATILTGDLVAPAQRGRAVGLLHTVGDFGSAVGPSVGYLLLPWVGLRAVYLLCAVMFLLSLVVVTRRAKSPGRKPVWPGPDSIS